VIFLDSNQTQ